MRRGLILGFALLLAASAGALAETYPSKTIRVIIPFGAASATGRHSAHRVRSALAPARAGHRGGESRRAGGTIGSTVRRQGRSGWLHAAGQFLRPIRSRRRSTPICLYDVASDFAAVGAIGSVPNVLIVAPSKGLKTLGEFVDAAKAMTRLVSTSHRSVSVRRCI